jgi:hypothetical protein
MPKTVEAKEKVVKEPKEKKDKGIGKRKEASLKAMKLLGGKKLTHAAIAEETGAAKGNQLRDLIAMDLVDVNKEGEVEGKRVHLYSLTAEGRKVASKLV